jgi:hypothetical protein
VIASYSSLRNLEVSVLLRVLWAFAC